MFNLFFAKQCAHTEIGSNLPTQIFRKTNESWNTINFTEDDILSVIIKLNPDKVHGYDQINACMYQICDKAIWKPFPMEELYQLRQEVKKLNMEEVNSGKERYNDFLPNHL